MKKPRIPKRCLHKATNQAYVRLNGEVTYLGDYDNPASQERYDRLIAEWLANGRQPLQGDADLSVTQLCINYCRYATKRYSREDGTPTGTLGHVKDALRDLRQLYGRTPADEFGPKKLAALQKHMTNTRRDGKNGMLARNTVNARIGVIKRMFKWAVAQQVVPSDVWYGLAAVDNLRAGEAKAPKKVTPVSEAAKNAVLEYVSPVVATMIELQWLTGMRSHEVCSMRPKNIDRTGGLWKYRPAQHKTEHHGHERLIHLGPLAQKLIAPFIEREEHKRLFTPEESEFWHRHRRTLRRKTDRRWGNRVGTNRVRQPKRRPGHEFTPSAYRQTIGRGCDMAFKPPPELEGTERERWVKDHRWTPHQLRHAAATRIRKQYGLEVAALLCGHSSAKVTEAVYAERDYTKVQQVVAAVG